MEKKSKFAMLNTIKTPLKRKDGFLSTLSPPLQRLAVLKMLIKSQSGNKTATLLRNSIKLSGENLIKELLDS
jgi:hypothetical protein